MLLFYIRHGDPDYSVDGLTPRGARQAEAVGRRLSTFGMDKIYTSPLGRAKLTAQPTCELLGKEAEVVEWASEANAWHATTVPTGEGDRRTWAFHHAPTRELFAREDVRRMGREFYHHPALAGLPFAENIPTVQAQIDEWLLSLGYRHDLERNGYIAERPNDDRVALFAHQGFGMLFLSLVLDIPYPMLSTRADIQHSGVSVIRFGKSDGLIFPTLLQLSNDSHLYREGLPTRYNNQYPL